MNEADQLIAQCRSVALQHYPDEVHAAVAYQKCYAALLETKIRELLYRAPALQVYDNMIPAKLAAQDRVGEVTLPVAPDLVVIPGGKT